jgi:hypothetical protein
LRRSSARTPDQRARSRRPPRGGLYAWLAFGVAALVLASPLRLAWARAELGWTFPFFLWLALIGLGVALGRDHEDDGDGHGDGDAT